MDCGLKNMGKIQKFEDILAWQKARELTREVYAHSKTGAFAKDFGLRDQIQRASVSIRGNVAEGFDRGGDKEFIQFLSVSKGCCGEVKSHLTLPWTSNTSIPRSSTSFTTRLTKWAGCLPGLWLS